VLKRKRVKKTWGREGKERVKLVEREKDPKSMQEMVGLGLGSELCNKVCGWCKSLILGSMCNPTL
jgi:hypothetical protein